MNARWNPGERSLTKGDAYRAWGAVACPGAGSLAAAGCSLGFWSVCAQLDRGRGTPLPMVPTMPTMPTQELLTDGPFRYCRNPMTLGAVLAHKDGISTSAEATAEATAAAGHLPGGTTTPSVANARSRPGRPC